MNKNCRVHFVQSQKSATVPRHMTVLEAARQLEIDLPSYCAGAGICAGCKVKITKGRISPSPVDRESLTSFEIKEGFRLACQARISEDCTVEVIASRDKDKGADFLTEGKRGRITPKPAVEKRYVRVPEPTLEENPSDAEDLISAADLSPGINMVPLDLLRKLPGQLRRCHYEGTLVLHDGHILDFHCNDTCGQKYGFAVDIGTTTVAGKLIDLTSGVILATVSGLNTQQKYGQDVISRISYANSDGLQNLHQAAVGLVNSLIGDAIDAAGIGRDHIYEVVIAGNTVMEHLFCGIDPHYLAEMPYVPVFKESQLRTARELGLDIHENGKVYLFPIIGRYVGGDTVAMLLTLASRRLKSTWLAVDIGTNGEILLNHRGQLSACSTAAGPAFEGGHIHHGMRAERGAIDRVFMDRDGLTCHVIGDVPPVGICGSGLIDLLGALLQSGTIDESGKIIEQPDDAVPATFVSRSNGQLEIIVTRREKITLSQKDIRELQLAKGAIATGIQILLGTAGLGPGDLDAVYLAGAFGQYIRTDMARRVGLLPDCPGEKIHFIGNAACAGAETALLSMPQRRLAERLARETRYVEISTDPGFQDLFAQNMLFQAME